jgi:hypothetical protein
LNERQSLLGGYLAINRKEKKRRINFICNCLLGNTNNSNNDSFLLSPSYETVYFTVTIHLLYMTTDRADMIADSLILQMKK